MNVKFYSLTSLPAAVAGAAGSFVNVTAGENAGMYYCTGDKFIRLDNVAQDWGDQCCQYRHCYWNCFLQEW